MCRCILTAVTAGVILLAFAVLPPMSSGSVMLSGSALAQKKDPTTNAVHLNTSRSNIYRKGGGGGAGAPAAKRTSKMLNPQPEPPGRR